MSFVEDLVMGSNPMKHLIMSQEKQEMIEAVAGSPRKGTALKPWTTDWSADFIEGKGRGQVIFLHGMPRLDAYSYFSSQEAQDGTGTY